MDENYKENKNKILDINDKRYVEIYKIICKINNKSYIGQAVSHVINHNKLRPFGMEGRFKKHVQEAFSNKKKQCQYLNNAIKKYGIDSFILELLIVCEINEADYYENDMIIKHETLFPKGYNLKSGGKSFKATLESKQNLSKAVVKFFEDKKYEKFNNISLLKHPNEYYIKPLYRDKKQYGWYICIEKIKADFGGKHISLEESKKMVNNFINNLRNKLEAKYLDAGSSLEPTLPLSNCEVKEELD